MVSRTHGGWRFELIRPGAQRAYLVGDFNGWSTTAIQMTTDTRGLFHTTIDLEPGTYHFRYFVDDMWLVDYAAFGLDRNTLGQWDSVVYVPEVGRGKLEVRSGNVEVGTEHLAH
jgi:1,4-alpha-glucan branching enzyme